MRPNTERLVSTKPTWDRSPVCPSILTDCSLAKCITAPRLWYGYPDPFSLMCDCDAMPDEPFSPLTTEAEWSTALEHSNDTPVLVFKHSSACPVSAKANQQLQQLGEEDELPIYKLVVQESRALSNDIAERLDIRHETPQAILLHQQEPVFNTSHFDVTVETVQEALEEVTASS